MFHGSTTHSAINHLNCPPRSPAGGEFWWLLVVHLEATPVSSYEKRWIDSRNSPLLTSSDAMVVAVELATRLLRQWLTPVSRPQCEFDTLASSFALRFTSCRFSAIVHLLTSMFLSCSSLLLSHCDFLPHPLAYSDVDTQAGLYPRWCSRQWSLPSHRRSPSLLSPNFFAELPTCWLLIPRHTTILSCSM